MSSFTDQQIVDLFHSGVRDGIEQVRRVDTLRAVILTGIVVGIIVFAVTGFGSYLVGRAVTESRVESLNAKDAKICLILHDFVGLGQETVTAEREETEDFKSKSKDRLGLTPAQFDALLHKKEERNLKRQDIINRLPLRACGR